MNTLRFWQDKLAQIYPNTDKSPDYLMAHVYTACSDLGRLLIRNQNDDRCDKAIIKGLSWMIALSNHLRLDYESAVVKRFPGFCPYCLCRPCDCDSTGRRARQRGRILSSSQAQEELISKYNSIRHANTPITFDWLIGQIAAVYPSNRALLKRGGQVYVTGKMLEEGGELHRAYSAYLLGGGSQVAIESELADLTAWLVSCWDLNGDGKDLDAEFASSYAGGCHHCRKTPCVCPTYSITMGQEECIRNIAAQLRALQSAGVQNESVDEALATAETVAATPTRTATRTLAQKVRLVLTGLKVAEQSSGAISGIAKHLGEAADVLQDAI